MGSPPIKVLFPPAVLLSKLKAAGVKFAVGSTFLFPQLEDDDDEDVRDPPGCFRFFTVAFFASSASLLPVLSLLDSSLIPNVGTPISLGMLGIFPPVIGVPLGSMDTNLYPLIFFPLPSLPPNSLLLSYSDVVWLPSYLLPPPPLLPLVLASLRN